jgi:hypothetical protein
LDTLEAQMMAWQWKAIRFPFKPLISHLRGLEHPNVIHPPEHIPNLLGGFDEVEFQIPIGTGPHSQSMKVAIMMTPVLNTLSDHSTRVPSNKRRQILSRVGIDGGKVVALLP